MKAVNLYEATEVLERVRRKVMGVENELDKRAREMYGVEPDMDIMLLEHDKPDEEPFPDKKNQKSVEPKIKGNTSITEVEKLVDS